jgi:osmotically inducible protein OsmC
MSIVRTGSATWTGGRKDGRGAISTQSGAVKERPYGFATRFEGEPGTNPEELLGAAHAACFTMALSVILEEAGLRADRLDTVAKVTLARGEAGWSIPAIHLVLRGSVPGADEATFRELAAKAKANCPVSRVLRAEVSLDASLAGTGRGTE